MKTRLLLPLAAMLLFSAMAARVPTCSARPVGGGVGCRCRRCHRRLHGRAQRRHHRQRCRWCRRCRRRAAGVAAVRRTPAPWPITRLPRFATFRAPCRASATTGTGRGHAWGLCQRHERRPSARIITTAITTDAYAAGGCGLSSPCTGVWPTMNLHAPGVPQRGDDHRRKR